MIECIQEDRLMMLSRILLAGSLMFLTTCSAGGVRLTHQQTDMAYDSGEVAYAGAGRDLLVEIYGNPFDSDTAAFPKAVTDAMQGRNWGQRMNFTTTPGENARTLYKVVLLFNPPVTLLAQKLCSESAEALAARPTPGGGINVLGAFCRSDKSLTEIKGYIETASGHDDIAFRELVGQVTQGLFPPDRRDDNDNNCRVLFRCN